MFHIESAHGRYFLKTIVVKLDTIKKIYIFFTSISSEMSKKKKKKKRKSCLCCLSNFTFEMLLKNDKERVAFFFATEV